MRAECGLLALACGTPCAWSADLDFTVGTKLWAAEWSSWDPVPTGSGGVSVVESVAANTTLAPIVQGSVRYGHWLAAASYFVTTSYDLGGAIDPHQGTLSALAASRKEVDVNAGYFLASGFAATLGYKQIDQSFGGNPYKWSGPTVGLSGGAPVYDALSMYSTFAYGRLSVSAPATASSVSSGAHADYFLGELGVSYGFDTPLSGLSLSVTLGYRIQIVGTRALGITTGPASHTGVDVHDVTYGPAIGVAGRF
jgi:hypothetical protein